MLVPQFFVLPIAKGDVVLKKKGNKRPKVEAKNKIVPGCAKIQPALVPMKCYLVGLRVLLQALVPFYNATIFSERCPINEQQLFPWSAFSHSFYFSLSLSLCFVILFASFSCNFLLNSIIRHIQGVLVIMVRLKKSDSMWKGQSEIWNEICSYDASISRKLSWKFVKCTWTWLISDWIRLHKRQEVILHVKISKKYGIIFLHRNFQLFFHVESFTYWLYCIIIVAPNISRI